LWLHSLGRHSDAVPILELSAPAKINLGLRIVGRRGDGYHELESLFLPLELADRVELGVELDVPGGVELALEGADPCVPGGAENLAVRAARAFLGVSGVAARLRIGLQKVVPVSAGLGGGSSDAGAILRGLAGLFPGAVPRLADLALELGADVPFFLDPRPARVGGIGEEIEPVDEVPALSVVLLLPESPLSTAHVYSAWDASGAALTPPAADSTMRLLSALRRLQTDAGRISVEEWAEALRNDLEPTSVRLCPGITELSRNMSEVGAVAVGMSGSGPTVFGLFESESEARKAEGELSSRGRERVLRTRTVGSS
jgi:4-diphosphocytidyl-2-C-methyl-D-erythritol kinase